MNRRQFMVGVPAACLLTRSLFAAGEADPTRVGSERQLFLDDFWFARRSNVRLALHRPVPREAVITCDRPWEKEAMHYSCVVRDAGRYRMWYRVDDQGEPGTSRRSGKTWICYAESSDGVAWNKPNLGLVAWGGSRENNILFPNEVIRAANGCCVIIDPRATSDERYKMIVAPKSAELWGYVSADGLRWRPAKSGPLFDWRYWGFDSHNVLVYDEKRQRYVIYCRGWQDKLITVDGPGKRPEDYSGMYRVIRRSESADFRTWSDPEVIIAADADDPPGMDFYTNAAIKYPRAARAWFMFPMVLHGAGRHYAGAPNPGTSDVQFMTSRDGVRWDRRFRQSYIRHGQDVRNWVDRNPIVGVGVVPTGPEELSLYYSDLYRSPQTRLRRATLRTDGFVSVEGPYAGGEFVTHPLVFSGRQLELNYRTSGGGAIRVELQHATGKAVTGFSLDDCPVIFGDKINGVLRWKDGNDLGKLAGKSIRLRVQLRDADLFAFRFRA